MLNALEGERPIPRHKPPHQTSSGLWSKPTVVNNVETLAYVPADRGQRGRVVQGPGPVGRGRDEDLHGQRQGEAARSLGAAHGHHHRANWSKSTPAGCG